MDVFVITVGSERYEHYSEQPLAADSQPGAPASGQVGRLKQRFEDRLRRAERWEPSRSDAKQGFAARLHDRTMAWVAERVAEQRLLWNLHRESTVTAAHPDDLSPEQTQAIVRRILQHDLERHQYWAWVDGVLFLVTFIGLGPIFILIPGIANLPALYFGFRAVGHWYARGGAKCGLSSVAWTDCPCSPLTELRHVPRFPPETREAHVQAISSSLRLKGLASFYDRVSKASL
jgi:hypothetical protein